MSNHNNHQPFQQISPVRGAAEKEKKPSIKQKFNNLVRKIKRAVFCSIALIVITSLALVYLRGGEIIYAVMNPSEIQILQSLDSDIKEPMLKSGERLQERVKKDKAEEVNRQFEGVSKNDGNSVIGIAKAAEAKGNETAQSGSVTESQIRELAAEHNFRWPDYLVRLLRCENTDLYLYAENTEGNDPAWSVDRGLCQINDYHHPEVSDECAYDFHCSLIWTMDRINAGYQHEWVCNQTARRK